VKQAVHGVNEAVLAIQSSAETLKMMLDRINTSKGTFNMMISDSLVAGHIRNSLMQIDSSTAKLDENMEALKHHFLFRGYYKKQEKEKKKKQEQQKTP
jgi:phospholipid/cholesterol/gamma-HCH transport system substrate-binding protein